MNNENNSNYNDDLKARIERAKQKARMTPLEQDEHEEVVDENESEVTAEEAMYEELQDGSEDYNDGYAAAKTFSKKDLIIKIAAILLSLIIIILLVFNMPIIAYTQTGKPRERVSIITFFKRWQPLKDIEGELRPHDKESLNLNTDIVTPDFSDGLDLPQIIEGQYTVLFLGFDEKTTNTDVNWVFQFDIAKAKLNVLQIPRDSFMPSYTGNVTGKFNSIYGGGDASLTPIQRTVDAVQDNFGIPIDAYVTTHCYDIVDIVDLVGGIPIELDEKIVYEADKIIPAGKSTLSGQQAEWFVRFRHGFAEGDIGRVKNQRKFLAAAMTKMMNIIEDEGRIKFYGYLKEIYDKKLIATNLSIESITMLADLASTISMDNVTVTMVPGEGEYYYAPDGKKYSVWSIHKQATLDILNKTFRPYQNPITPEYSAIYELVGEGEYSYSSYDNTGDNLQDIQNGAKPGVNKPKEDQ